MSSNKLQPNKIFLAFFLLITPLLFTACQQLEAAATDDARLAQAVQEGILISPDELVASGMAFTTVEAREGRLTRHMTTQMVLHFPVRVDLSFEQSGGRLAYRNANTMQFVEEGEVLFSVNFDVEALQIEEQQLLLRMAEADRRHNSERIRRQSDIERMRSDLGPSTADVEIQALRLERLEAEYQNAIRQFNLTRREQTRQLEDIQERIAGIDILAPFDAVVVSTNPARLNSVIYNWMIMVTLYDYNTFQLMARSSPDNMRYGDIVQVTDSNGNQHDARVVSDPLANSSVRAYHYDFMLEPLDPTITAENFAQGNLNAQPISIDIQGILIPSRAINIEDNRRYIYIYQDNIIRKRYIQTGFFYGDMTQVLDGVKPGQLVVLH